MPPSASFPGDVRQRTARGGRGEGGRRQPLLGRMGLRKFLEKLLNNKECHGLEWVDKAKKTFSIVWRHASSHGFDQTRHASVFKLWATYRGRTAEKLVKTRVKEGTYNSTLKANFRCALRSLIDCIELTHNRKENTPKKIFQFIEPSHPQYKERRDKKKGSYKKQSRKMKRCEIEVPFDDKRDKDSDDSASGSITPIVEPMTDDDETLKLKDIQAFLEAYSSRALKTENNATEASMCDPESTPAELPQHLPLQELAYDASSGVLSITTNPQNELQEEAKGETVTLPPAKISPPSPSQIPDFKALGVKDQYGPQTFTNNAMFGSGGTVTVRKPTQEESQLKGFQFPQENIETGVFPREIGPITEASNILNDLSHPQLEPLYLEEFDYFPFDSENHIESY